jgi:hypothetical protein
MSSIFKLASKFEKKIAAHQAQNLTNQNVLAVGKMLKTFPELKGKELKSFLESIKEKVKSKQMDEAIKSDNKDPIAGLFARSARYHESDSGNSLTDKLINLKKNGFTYCNMFYMNKLKDVNVNLQLITNVIDLAKSAVDDLNSLSRESFVQDFPKLKPWIDYNMQKLNAGLGFAESIQKNVQAAQQQGIAPAQPAAPAQVNPSATPVQLPSESIDMV